MEPNETQAVTEAVDEQPAPRRRKKRIWAFAGLGTVVLVAALVVLFAVVRKGQLQNLRHVLTTEDIEQLKYDSQQAAHERNRADQIRDGALLLRKEDADTQAQLNSLMGQLQKDSGTDLPLPMADDRQVRTEEEAIAQVIREPRPASHEPAVPESRRAQASSAPMQPAASESSERPMFVYSRTFGGAKYVDSPKNPGTTQVASFTREPKVDKPTASTGDQQIAREQKTDASEKPQGSEARASQQDKAAVIFTEHPPVTLFEGEMIDSVLVNRIIADTEPSPVICQISKDVFDNTGRYVVLPAGSRILGLSQVVNYKGAHRLFISFHRIVLPNGPSIDFPPSRRAMKALDETGALGVVSKVERHWFLQFGTAIFFGVLDGLSGAAQRSRDVFSTRSVVLGRTSENFQRILDNIMAQYSSIVPTIRVDQGKRMKIYLSDDVLMSPYARITDRSYYANR